MLILSSGAKFQFNQTLNHTGDQVWRALDIGFSSLEIAAITPGKGLGPSSWSRSEGAEATAVIIVPSALLYFQTINKLDPEQRRRGNPGRIIVNYTFQTKWKAPIDVIVPKWMDKDLLNKLMALWHQYSERSANARESVRGEVHRLRSGPSSVQTELHLDRDVLNEAKPWIFDPIFNIGDTMPVNYRTFMRRILRQDDRSKEDFPKAIFDGLVTPLSSVMTELGTRWR